MLVCGQVSWGKFRKAFFWMLLCSQGNMKQQQQLSLKIRGDTGTEAREDMKCVEEKE